MFSPQRSYRYALWRETGVIGAEGQVLFVMLNPSTADETKNDPTVARCLRFAGDWGYARLAVGNLFAYRATDPTKLRDAADPIGPLNDMWLRKLNGESLSTILAWGANKAVTSTREDDVIDLLSYGGSVSLECLEQTREGHPRHPLYTSRSEPGGRVDAIASRRPGPIRKPRPFVRCHERPYVRSLDLVG